MDTSSSHAAKLSMNAKEEPEPMRPPRTVDPESPAVEFAEADTTAKLDSVGNDAQSRSD